MSRRSQFTAALLTLASGILISLIGVGLSLPNGYTPKKPYGAFSAIAQDGWVVSDSVVTLPSLAPFLSIIDVTFDPWRPGSVGPAHVGISFCNTEVPDFLLLPEASRQRFRLGTECGLGPVEIRFLLHNPVRAGPTDNRMIGMRLESVGVSSVFGFPVPVIPSVGVFSLLTSIVLGLSVVLFTGRFRVLAFAFTAAASLFLLSTFEDASELELYSLFGVGILLLLGLLYSKLCPEQTEKKISSTQAYYAGIVAIVLLASVLRMSGLDFGLPAPYHPDELKKAGVIVSMQERESLNPQYFLHPSMLLYASYGVYSVVISHISSLDVESGIILAGRSVSALAGIISVVLLVLIGTKLHSRRLGLFAGALLAVFPLHVTCSRYLKEDSLLVCFLLLAFYFTLRAAESRKFLDFVLSASAVGLAAGTKYSGVLGVGLLLSAPWITSRSFVPTWKLFPKIIFALLIFVPLGFLLCTPYAVLDTSSFFKGIAFETEHMLIGHGGEIDAWSQYWMYHLRRSLMPGVQVFPLLLFLLAVGVAIGTRNVLWLVVAASALGFYLPAEWVKAKPAPQPERYVLPCLPFIALLASWLVLQLPERSTRILVAVLLLAFPAYASFRLALELKHDTREQMASWMREELPEDSHLAVDGGFYSPAFLEKDFQVKHLHVSTKPWEYRSGSLKRRHVDYVVLSSLSYDRYFEQPNAPKAIREVYKQLFGSLALVKEVKPQYKTYGFHNPTVRLYAVTPEARAALSSSR